MNHDDFAFEPIRGLPAVLPKGESLLWQGVPRWSSLAVHGYHIRKVAIYFAVLALARIGFGIGSGHSGSSIAVSCVFILALGGLAIGVLSLLAYLNAASTVYSITDRRVLLRHGIAVPITMNIPFTLIESAGVKRHRDGTGEIALRLVPEQRVGYLITWPHLRSGHFARPQPSFARWRMRRGPRTSSDRHWRPLEDTALMTGAIVDRTLPRGALAGAGALVVLSLSLVGMARITGYQPAKPHPSTVVESRDLRFVDRADGAVLIYAGDAAPSGIQQPADVLQPGTNGFVRGVLRGLVRERRADRIGEEPPFRLTRWADGRLSLDDPSTGRHVDLEVFGPTNAGAFAQILIASGRMED